MANKALTARNHILNNFGDMNDNFANLKEFLTVNELMDFFSNLEASSYYQRYFSNLNKLESNALISKDYFPTIYLAKNYYKENINKCNAYELKFLTAFICHNRNTINHFINLRNRFEQAFMLSSFSAAEAYLDEIESAYGYSFWSIEARFALYFVGDMKQTAFEYCNEITYSVDEYIRYHLEILRDKMSLDINQGLFQDRFDNKINLMGKVSDYEKHILRCLQAYTHFSCFINNTLTKESLRDLLVSSSVLSTIDKFILMEKIMIGISIDSTDEYDNKFLKIYKECLNVLSQNISSVLWDNICLLLGDSKKITINDSKRRVHTALSFFCSTNYPECWNYCSEQLSFEANNFPLINLMAKIAGINEPKTQYESLINFINSLYKKSLDEKEFYDMAAACDTYERFYSNFTFGNELIAIIENEFSCNSITSKKKYMAALVRYNFTPSKLAFFIPESNKKSFVDQYKKELTKLYLCDWQLMTYSDIIKESTINDFICDETSLILLQISKDPQKDIDRTASQYGFLVASYNTKLLFNSYVDANLYKGAIDTYIESYFLNKWLVLKIDYSYLNRRITKNLEQSLGSSIEYCVYCMLTKFNLQHAEKISESVVSSYKRIMRKNKEDYPSNLPWPDKELHKKCHAFFLRFICTDYVLHRCTPPFDLQQDIDEERKNILSSLIEYYSQCQDHESVTVLKKEAHTLSESTQTLDIINLLDEAKIDLNWILLNDTTDDAIVLAYNRCFVENLDRLSPPNSQNERYHEFLAGLASCKKNYVHEVNRILSLCIRHGVLEDQLILFLNQHGIVKTNLPCNNAFFSEVYKIINSVIEKHIIATAEKNDSGKISLYIPEEVAHVAYMDLSSTLNSPEELKNYYLTILNNQLEKELQKIRDIIFDALYFPLEKSLNSFIVNSKDIDKSDYIKCRDSLENELLIIKQWFQIIKYKETQYNLNTFLNVFKTKYPKIRIASSISNTYKIHSNIIGCLYNIIFNLLNNASKHSGFSEYSDELGLFISIQPIIDVPNWFTFTLSNNVSSFLDNDVIINNVNNINLLKKKKEEIETYTPMEGKSGYHKIIRILERNFKDAWDLNVFFDKNNRTFNVKLCIGLE